jgi:hypothetical protein
VFVGHREGRLYVRPVRGSELGTDDGFDTGGLGCDLLSCRYSCMCSAMSGTYVWYEANGLCKVQDIKTMSEILDPHRLDEIKRRLLFEGEAVEMVAEREGVTVEWMNEWIWSSTIMESRPLWAGFDDEFLISSALGLSIHSLFLYLSSIHSHYEDRWIATDTDTDGLCCKRVLDLGSQAIDLGRESVVQIVNLGGHRLFDLAHLVALTLDLGWKVPNRGGETVDLGGELSDRGGEIVNLGGELSDSRGESLDLGGQGLHAVRRVLELLHQSLERIISSRPVISISVSIHG